MSEQTIINAMQTTFGSMTDFSDADVVDGDYSILDGPLDNAPYVLFELSDFDSRQDTVTPDTTWQIPVLLIIRFVDWPTSLVDLRTRRQAIIDKFNEVGTNRSPGADGTKILTVLRIYNDGDFVELYDKYADPTSALPDFLTQRIIFEVREN